MTADTRLRVGIVGTGEMGTPLALRLLDAGHHVTAFARRPEAREGLTALGLEVVEGVRALGPGRDVVIVYVYADDQVRAVTLDDGLIDVMDPGSTVIIATTGSPATARIVADGANVRGISVVDAPGSGSPAQIADGTLSLFVGGADEAVERCRPVFEAYASNIYHLGPLGSGQMVKLINNLLFGCHVELAVEACRLAASVGIDDATLARTLHTGSGQSYSLDLVGALGSTDQLLAGVGHFVHKDVVVARDVAADIGVPLGTFAAAVTAILERTRPTAIGSEHR